MNTHVPTELRSTGHFVSAPWRSSGKSIVTMGLARLAAKRFTGVQTFKKGPDYIDPQWLKHASGRACYNLDSYMQDENDISALFAKHTSECVLVEGTMGLHDGLCVHGSDSNAAIAKLLGLPVLLVIDCRGMHRTIAPLVNGIMQFDSKLAFSGVVLNRIRSERHAGKIERAINTYCDTCVLGMIPERPELCIDERELGLVPAEDHSSAVEFIDTVANTLRESCNTDAILQSNADLQLNTTHHRNTAHQTNTARQTNTTLHHHVQYPRGNPARNSVANATQTTPASLTLASLFNINNSNSQGVHAGLRIGIARDKAFHFYYEDDLDTLRASGVTLVEFSPMHDALPAKLDGLLIGGGFPERHLKTLSDNACCREALAEEIANGLPVRAECGGLMYLCQSISVDKVLWPMVGVVDGTVIMHDKPKGRGYMQLRTKTKGSLPAHEFHHSTVVFNSEPDCAFDVKRGFGLDGKRDGVRVNNLIASYAHFRHSARTPWIDWFLESVQRERRHSQVLSHV